MVDDCLIDFIDFVFMLLEVIGIEELENFVIDGVSFLLGIVGKEG